MSQQPNIIVILSDQLRRQALSCQGDPNIQTPHIDALASGGTRFSAASSTYPVCVPFRFSLMTGQTAHSRQVPGLMWRMSPAERTLADEFNEAGYHTAYIGKWHLYGGGGYAMAKRPVPRDYQGNWQKWLAFEYRNNHFDTVVFEDDDPTPRPLNAFQTDGLFDLAINHLRARKNSDSAQPFCCVVSVEPPHTPMEAPPELEEKWLGRELELPPNFMVAPAADELEVKNRAQSSATAPQRGEIMRRNQLYYAMVENLDQNVGHLMEFLQNEGLDENTIVVFVADHGEMCGSHGLVNKQYPYEESVGIPLIIWGPGCGVAANKVCAEPTCTEDLFPTLCGLAGFAPRDKLSGVDLCELIRGEASQLERPGVMLEYVLEQRSMIAFFRQPWRGFRGRRYKYTVLGCDGELRPWQFFDLEADPYELNNLVANADFEPQIRQHHQWLRARMIETGDNAWLSAAWDCEALNAWVPCQVSG